MIVCFNFTFNSYKSDNHISWRLHWIIFYFLYFFSLFLSQLCLPFRSLPSPSRFWWNHRNFHLKRIIEITQCHGQYWKPPTIKGKYNKFCKNCGHSAAPVFFGPFWKYGPILIYELGLAAVLLCNIFTKRYIISRFTYISFWC